MFVVLYGCETWSLTLREKRRLRVFENKVLRRISGPRSDEVTGDWRSCKPVSCSGRTLHHAVSKHEPHPRRSAQSPSPSGSEPCYFFRSFLHIFMTVVRGLVDESWGEGWGRFVCVFLEGNLCPDRHLPACTLGIQFSSRRGISASTSRGGFGQPRRTRIA